MIHSDYCKIERDTRGRVSVLLQLCVAWSSFPGVREYLQVHREGMQEVLERYRFVRRLGVS